MMEPNGSAWLSITPEPEAELPWAIAALRTGGSPTADAVAAEEARIEKLVLHGAERNWRQWLRETRAVAARARSDQTSVARVALEVIDNHDALALGLERREKGRTRR